MTRKITEIPFWGIFLDCFSEQHPAFIAQDESAITDEQWLTIARWWRNALLNESDWSQVPDNSLTESQRESYRQYRQELREITESVPNPKDIVFPTIPTA
jgi:hypothetical protein